jgi:hypothetical protein
MRDILRRAIRRARVLPKLFSVSTLKLLASGCRCALVGKLVLLRKEGMLDKCFSAFKLLRLYGVAVTFHFSY